MEIALFPTSIRGFLMNNKNTIIYKELDSNDPEIVELNRLGSLVPLEVERQAREYEEQMKISEQAFGEAVRSIKILGK